MTTLVCMGTRPEIIKMAPVVHALQQAGLAPQVLHTGQHEDMAWPLYAFFDIEPMHTIQLARQQPGLAHLSAELLTHIDAAIERTQPRCVLVHGDTSSAVMGATAAFYQQVPIAHVEAGLRSGNKHEPFPEEMNRQQIGRMATWHFAPTTGAVASLRAEGVEQGVFCVGNTVVDAALWASQRLNELEQAGRFDSASSRWFQASGCRQLVVVTAHRRENWGEPMRDVLNAVARLLNEHPELAVVWPVHLNPVVKDMVQAVHDSHSASGLNRRWLLCPPMHYPELLNLMRRSELLITDSGGIQEEAVALNKRTLILRNVTERPEVVSCGLGELVGTQADRIVASASRILLAQAAGRASDPHFVNPFGDGTAALQIARHLQAALPQPVATAAQATATV